MKNRIDDLRNHLFETLEALKDEDKPMDLERAKTVSEVAQTLINSAKVEVDYLRVTGDIDGTGFIDNKQHTVQGPGLKSVGHDKG